LIGHNENRFPKEQSAIKGEGREVKALEFTTMAEENQQLAAELLRLNKEGLNFSDMAVLVRMNMGSGPLLHKLMEYNIPFRMRDSLPNLFEHWIASDIITYIKIALGSSERGHYLQIINRPKRYVSRDCFDTPEVELDSVKDYYEDKNWMLERLDQLEYDLALLSRMSPYAAVNYIRKGIGYEEFLKEYADFRRMKAEELFDILDELQESAKEFKTYQDWFHHMEVYKEELKRQAIDNRSLLRDSVTVATMHSSKGLEYRAVFIMDASEGVTPHKKAVLTSDIEEERRLFYVAMTRAKEYLYLLNAKERYNKVMTRSRFLEELMKAEEAEAPGNKR
jgi:DNA helicase-2/ATP-dependent DNA helicase PcrA